MTNKREDLLKKINLLNEQIHQLRRVSEDYSLETEELIRLILELDSLDEENEE